MKKLLTIGAITLLSVLAITNIEAQDTNSAPPLINTNQVPTLGSALTDIGEFLSYASTNITYIGFGTIAQNNHGKYGVGGGAALMYNISQYVGTGIRFDYLNSAFYEGSFDATFQLPIQINSWLRVTPFIEGGVAVPFGGGASGNAGTVQGIAGTGFAVKLGSSGFLSDLRILAAIEKWSAIPGEQIRIGLAYHKSI